MKEIHLKYKQETGKSIEASYPSTVSVIAIYEEQFPEIIYTREYVEWLEEENEKLQKQLNPFLGILATRNH